MKTYITGHTRQLMRDNKRKIRHDQKAGFEQHKLRVQQDLVRLGVSHYGRHLTESRYLPYILHDDEMIGGIAYGQTDDGLAMLIATDRRVIFLDKKPLFVLNDEVTYGVVSGVSYSAAGFGSTVTLHTRIKDYTLHTFNEKCTRGFVKFIESRTLENKQEQQQEYWT